MDIFLRNEMSDRRFEKSRVRIRNFLIGFLQNHEEGSLTISAICSAIKMDRHTFYHHYQNLSSLYDDFFRWLEEKMELVYVQTRSLPITEKVKGLIHFVFLNRCSIIAFMKFEKYFGHERFNDIICKKIGEILEDSRYSNLQRRMVVLSVISILDNCLNGNMPFQEEQLSEKIAKLVEFEMKEL